MPRARRRAHGVYYTPPELVDRVVAETLAPALGRAMWREDGSPELSVLDPACGDGRFLLACVEHLVAAARDRGFSEDTAREAIVRRCVTGVERDPAAARLARRALGHAGAVRIGEALLGQRIEDEAYDVVVGNPPYVRSVTLKREDPVLWRRLRGKLRATSYREWDLYAAFLERSLSWVRPGGEIGLVVPSRWFTAAFAAPLREHLAREGAVRKVVDYGEEQLFDGATNYIALVFLSRRRRAEVSVSVRRDGRWEEGKVPGKNLGRAPWNLVVGATARRLRRMEAAGPRLGEIACIKKGAGTNADRILLLAPDEAAGLEPDLLVPCVRGRDVGAYRLDLARLALLPYVGGGLVPPQDLAALPATRDYLERHRRALESRESGRYRDATFYRWGRPQNLTWHLDPRPKIVVPDAAREGRAALDRRGTLVIDTAYAIRPVDSRVPIGLLLAVLNSPAVRFWLQATGILLRGGYLRMKTAYLESLPVPDPTSPAAQALAADALRATPAERDGLAERVMRLYA